MQPPKKVIKAIKSYITPNANHICFNSGDFFHVIGHEDNSEYYLVSNPIQNVKGYVPVSHFEVMETRAQKLNRLSKTKTDPLTTISDPISVPSEKQLRTKASQMTLFDIISENTTFENKKFSNRHTPSVTLTEPISNFQVLPFKLTKKINSDNSLMTISSDSSFEYLDNSKPLPIIEPLDKESASTELHAVAIFSFTAEGKGELSVLEGDRLLVLAQSTEDWFVVEKIGSRSLVGLVPVSFVSFYDFATKSLFKDHSQFLSKYNLKIPSVSEWKKSKATSRKKPSSSNLKIRLTTSRYSDQCAPMPSSETAVNSSSSSASNNSISSDDPNIFFPYRSDSISAVYKTQSLPDPNLLNSKITNLKVTNFICKNGTYLFAIEFTIDNNSVDHIYRSYPEFDSFFRNISQIYPFLSTLLKPLNKNNFQYNFMNDNIASNRLSELHTFITSAQSMCPQMLSSPILYSFLDISNFKLKLSRTNSEIAKPLPHPLQPLFDDLTISPTIDCSKFSFQSLKIKLIHKDDMFAIRLPSDTSYNTLLTKVSNKLYPDSIDPVSLSINCKSPSGSLLNISNDSSWYSAIMNSNGKLTFIIES
ncbi:Protein scd2/ral3 [Smittium culicis]|uniref:Protein scd2/ral3 n=1 Tax=Smittium culicis TaxID=133412 RepID=A0A1R1YMZ7_9FUNG|nr:Protein scd2/ral3 [Smittium culicis]